MFLNDVKSRFRVLPVSVRGCGMALLDWRSKKDRDSGGLDTDSHIRRKCMLISCLLMMMGSLLVVNRHCLPGLSSCFVSCCGLEYAVKIDYMNAVYNTQTIDNACTS